MVNGLGSGSGKMVVSGTGKTNFTKNPEGSGPKIGGNNFVTNPEGNGEKGPKPTDFVSQQRDTTNRGEFEMTDRYTPPGGTKPFGKVPSYGGMVGTTADPNQRKPFRVSDPSTTPTTPSSDLAKPEDAYDVDDSSSTGKMSDGLWQ